MTDPLGIARDLQRMTLHGPPPLATTMALAAEVIRLHALLTPTAPAPDVDQGQLVIPFPVKVPE